MNTSYDDVREALSEKVTARVQFLPCDNVWSPKRTRDLMTCLEDCLIGVTLSGRGLLFPSVIPEFLSYTRISLGRTNPKGAIAVENESSPDHLIRMESTGGLAYSWMDPGGHGGDNQEWRSWTDEKNGLVPDDAGGNSTVTFEMKDVPRVVVMALVDAIGGEDIRNELVSSDHPSFESILWVPFTFFDKEKVEERKKYIKEYYENEEARPSKKTKKHVLATATGSVVNRVG